MSFKKILPAVALCILAAACTAIPRQQPAASPTAPADGPKPVETAACPQPTACPAIQGEQQPNEIQGTFSFSNDIILHYYVEHAVSLTDMNGFVLRDKEWEIPVTSQNLGFLKIDAENQTGEFDIQLPAQPEGVLADVNPNDEDETGVQIFAAEYMPNLTGGPFAEGDDASRGWPSYLASVRTDSENQDEITGGMLMIWSPDAQQFFPNGFGEDGLLFTSDDPVMPVPQGYSAIDLDQSPFGLLRDSRIEMTLYEPQDVAIKDFSSLPYTEAFQKMFDIARKEYAFNGVAGKEPGWDALYVELAPRIAQAEQDKDAAAYYQALRDFTLAFQDGHVGLDGGEVGQRILSESLSGGFGFAVRTLDDGRVIVIHIMEGGPAALAGMQPGAKIAQFGGKPVEQAIQAVIPPSAPHSMESRLRAEQARYLVRAPLGAEVEVTYTNPGEAEKTVTLQAVNEQESLSVTSPFAANDPNGLPVEYVVATSDIGYIRINSNYDDLNLLVRLFQRALTKFEENELSTLIIDMRANSGGANLGLAGFLTEQEIPLGQLQYYSEKTGQFESERAQDRVLPNAEQYRFDKMYLLVDQACASACELEAYGFSQVPNMVVVGENPTSGTEAEVSRGQFQMPEGITLQIPTGRFMLPDGSIFLEGKGVEPAERVPVTESSVLSGGDTVIQKVIELANQ